MTSIGDTLRHERQRRNLDLPQISNELKISTRFLDAIERDDFGKLPGGVFTKSFVRQYAGFLGLDGEELVGEMERAMHPEPQLTQVPEEHRPQVPAIPMQLGENWQSVNERGVTIPSWVRAGVLLVALMLVCSGVYWWWQRPRHPVLAHETTAAAKTIPAAQTGPAVSQAAEKTPAAATPPTAEPAVAPPMASQEPSAQTVSAASPASAPAAAPPIPVFTPNPNATVHVGITADEVVWIRIEVNGKSQFEGILQPHETRNVDADGEVKLRLGNAGGATLTWNGKVIGPAGPKGQIRNVQFTSGGFQIVSPPKLEDPLDRL
jgi:cytoskeleton protein RodZ